MPRRQSLFAFVVSCAILCLCGAAYGQNTSTLSGTVTDPQGLAVRGAKVILTSASTATVRETVADEAGHFTLVGLVPGEYKLRVEGGTSFSPYEIPSVMANVGTETIVNVKLELGTQTQTVTVTTEGTQVETTRSESSQT